MNSAQGLEAGEGASQPIAVMHVTDTLELGGAERVAVNLANSLPRALYATHLCATRREGPLRELLAGHVGRLTLRRRHRFDLAAIKRLVVYVRDHNIQILHAHGASLFVAAAAATFLPHPAVVWHIHYGRSPESRRWHWAYRHAVRRADFVVAVNVELREWARRSLAVPPERSCYIPNFVDLSLQADTVGRLPGTDGSRVACVANLRPEKDTLTLLEAFQTVVAQVPEAQLLLVGGEPASKYTQAVHRAISDWGLEEHVSLLGSRPDVGGILAQCSVGVLSSASEGLPLALLEYGAAGLAAVATRVGQCAEVLDGGAGILVPARDTQRLAEAILRLLRSPELRESLAAKLKTRVESIYSRNRVVAEVCRVYERVLAPSARAAS